MTQTIDQRPPVAVGHVRLPATDVAVAAQWLEIGRASTDFRLRRPRGPRAPRRHASPRKEGGATPGSRYPGALRPDGRRYRGGPQRLRGERPRTLRHQPRPDPRHLPPCRTGPPRLHGLLVACWGEGGLALIVCGRACPGHPCLLAFDGAPGKDVGAHGTKSVG